MIPRVTIIIPCYQHGGLLAEAVGSALGQTHPELEIIIVDDGSTDNTRAVAEDFVRRNPVAVNYLYQSHQGQNVARQRGLETASGKYCLTLDADDLLEPEAIATCLATFEAHPAADAVVGNALIVGPDGQKVLRTHTQSTITPWPEVLKRNPYGVNLAVLARTSALRAAGGLGCARAGCEDWDLWYRMIRCGMQFVHVDAVLGRYRQTGQNHTRNVLGNLMACIAMLDLAAGEDPRLADSGKPVAPSINPEVYHLYRNGRVFYALGLALGFDNAGGYWDTLGDQMTTGRLDPSWCIEQFTEGMAFAWDQQPGERSAASQRRLLDSLERRALAKGQQQAWGEVRAGMIHAVRAITGHRSWVYLRQRLREKYGW